MLTKVISGGESGANQAAWRVAKSYGLVTGGWMPKGFLTDQGPYPEFAQQWGAAELPTDSQTDCTEKNVRDSDATVWFGDTTTSGAQAAVKACLAFGKPVIPIFPGAYFEPSQIAKWLTDNKIEVLNVAGNREHEEPRIGDRVEQYLGEVLERLGHKRAI
jgi:hypothetical protein